MIITVFIQNSCNLVNKRVMICVVCPVEIQFSVIFIQLGAKVEGATSKNDIFHVLGPLDCVSIGSGWEWCNANLMGT